MMKRFLFLAVAAMMATSVAAQMNLSGRVYHNPNILADKFNEVMKDGLKDIDQAKEKAYAKAEEKKGRKLTEAEKAKLEQEVQEGMAKLKALSKGMTTAVTVEFTSATDLVMKMKVRIDDEAMKAAGLNWIKRKAMKAALAVAPESHKGKYVQQGNLIIVQDEKEPDTLYLSADGKQLSGMMDKDKFTLTRTK